MNPVFKAYTKEGKLHIVHAESFRTCIEAYNGRPFEIIVRKVKKHRSNDQNSYYWGVCLALICEHTGYEPDELHEALKRKFLKRFDRKGLEFVESTTNLSTTEFMNYIEEIKRFAAMELDTVIPDPDGVLSDE